MAQIRYFCLVMSERYIKEHFDDIKKYASVIEDRLDDSGCTIESVLEENVQTLELCKQYKVNYVLIDEEYQVDISL